MTSSGLASGWPGWMSIMVLDVSSDFHGCIAGMATASSALMPFREHSSTLRD